MLDRSGLGRGPEQLPRALHVTPWRCSSSSSSR
jgi:hypothetical protein